MQTSVLKSWLWMMSFLDPFKQSFLHCSASILVPTSWLVHFYWLVMILNNVVVHLPRDRCTAISHTHTPRSPGSHAHPPFSWPGWIGASFRAALTELRASALIPHCSCPASLYCNLTGQLAILQTRYICSYLRALHFLHNLPPTPYNHVSFPSDLCLSDTFCDRI